mgnify:CR=1 FL=1
MKSFLSKSGLALGLALMAIGSVSHAHAEGGGPDQNVRIMTEPQGISAHCLVDNAAGQALLSTTPGMINVAKTTGRTRISCESFDGGWSGNAIITPHADAWSVLSGIPWIIFKGANDVVNDFVDRGGASATASTAVRFKDTIVIKMNNDDPPMPVAAPVSLSEAIANAPASTATPEPTPAPTADAPVHKAKHHHRQTYHPQASHS